MSQSQRRSPSPNAAAQQANAGAAFQPVLPPEDKKNQLDVRLAEVGGLLSILKQTSEEFVQPTPYSPEAIKAEAKAELGAIEQEAEKLRLKKQALDEQKQKWTAAEKKLTDAAAIRAACEARLQTFEEKAQPPAKLIEFQENIKNRFIKVVQQAGSDYFHDKCSSKLKPLDLQKALLEFKDKYGMYFQFINEEDEIIDDLQGYFKGLVDAKKVSIKPIDFSAVPMRDIAGHITTTVSECKKRVGWLSWSSTGLDKLNKAYADLNLQDQIQQSVSFGDLWGKRLTDNVLGGRTEEAIELAAYTFAEYEKPLLHERDTRKKLQAELSQAQEEERRSATAFAAEKASIAQTLQADEESYQATISAANNSVKEYTQAIVNRLGPKAKSELEKYLEEAKQHIVAVEDQMKQFDIALLAASSMPNQDTKQALWSIVNKIGNDFQKKSPIEQLAEQLKASQRFCPEHKDTKDTLARLAEENSKRKERFTQFITGYDVNLESEALNVDLCNAIRTRMAIPPSPKANSEEKGGNVDMDERRSTSPALSPARAKRQAEKELAKALTPKQADENRKQVFNYIQTLLTDPDYLRLWNKQLKGWGALGGVAVTVGELTIKVPKGIADMIGKFQESSKVVNVDEKSKIAKILNEWIEVAGNRIEQPSFRGCGMFRVRSNATDAFYNTISKLVPKLLSTNEHSMENFLSGNPVVVDDQPLKGINTILALEPQTKLLAPIPFAQRHPS